MALGTILLYIGLITAIYAAVANIMGSYRDDESWIRSGKIATYIVAASVAGATLLLAYYFVTDDFSVAYVVQNSMSTHPVVYKVSALWAGQGGSLLLWAAFLAVFAAIVARTKQKPGLSGYASGIIMLTEIFFIAIVVFLADPFVPSTEFWDIARTPVEGLGLNPMLINPGMLFHPPTLYAGYAGFVIPFAFAIAGLLKRDDDWVFYTRKWTVFAWLFLGIGILIGGWWAYVILGWGGYWAWDPVENGSLMPWLTGTAFLHSVMIQEKRGGLRVWNQVLIILTYVLTVYGVLLTRSGVVESAHTFAETGMSVWFTGFMAIALLGGLGLLLHRRDYIRDEAGLAESYVSKEVSFLLNNLVLLALFVAVWWGTSFPFISELLLGSKVSIGTSYFNQVTPPLAIALMVLMGVCPLLPWRNASWAKLKDSFTYPVIAGAAGAVPGYIFGGALGAAVLAIAAFVAGSHLLDASRAYRVLKGHHPDYDPLRAALRLVSRNRRRYGGYVVHFGIILILIGVAWSSMYSQEAELALQQGESAAIPGGYDVTYAGANEVEFPDHTEYTATVEVYDGGDKVYTANPSIGFYQQREMNTRNTDIWATLFRDVYFIFNGVTDGVASLTVKLNPLVYLIWIGGYLMMGGGALALWPEFSRRGEEMDQYINTTELLSKRLRGEEVLLAGRVKGVEADGRYVVTDGDSEILVEGGEPGEEGSVTLLRGVYDGDVFHAEEGCPECGAETSPDDQFCGSCGEELR